MGAGNRPGQARPTQAQAAGYSGSVQTKAESIVAKFGWGGAQSIELSPDFCRTGVANFGLGRVVVKVLNGRQV